MDTVTVHFFTCDCEWATKFCDEYHTATAIIPREVVEQYVIKTDQN